MFISKQFLHFIISPLEKGNSISLLLIRETIGSKWPISHPSPAIVLKDSYHITLPDLALGEPVGGIKSRALDVLRPHTQSEWVVLKTKIHSKKTVVWYHGTIEIGYPKGKCQSQEIIKKDKIWCFQKRRPLLGLYILEYLLKENKMSLVISPSPV